MAGKISIDFKGIWCLGFAGLSLKRKSMSLLQSYCNWEARVPDFLLSPPALHNFSFSVSFHACICNGLFSKLHVLKLGSQTILGPSLNPTLPPTIHQIHQEGGDGGRNFINGPFNIINLRTVFFWHKALLKLYRWRDRRIYSAKIHSYLYHHPPKKTKQINMGKQ